jgi:hypothetical protein
MDMYVGDWNRDASHWRWVAAVDSTTGKRVWMPVPLDDDRAFQRADGRLLAHWRRTVPELVVFDNKYPSLLSLTARAWALDRRVLQDLERSAFDSTARALQRVLTDAVIDGAVDRMPPEQRMVRGGEIAQALRRRRDQLPALADRFYRQLAEGADVRAPRVPTVVDVARRRDTLELRLRGSDSSSATYYVRRFTRNETREVRLYLEGNPDSVTVRGGGDRITLRIIPGRGRTVLVDSGTGSTIVYNHPYTAPAAGARTLVRDVGHACTTAASAGAITDIGGHFSVTGTCTTYGFRTSPWAWRQRVNLDYEVGSGGGIIDYLAEHRPTGSNIVWSLRARAASSEFGWFFGETNAIGVGNDTTFTNGKGQGEPFDRYREASVDVAPGLTVPVASHLTVTIAPELRYWQSGLLGGYVASLRPYGLGPFGTISGTVDARFDTRDNAAYATRGFDVHVTGRGVPAVWDASSPYGTIGVTAATYLTAGGLPLTPTLALRAGAEKVWGNVPFQDLAHIGGGGTDEFTVRGYLPDRFTGDASAFGNAQLELALLHRRIIVPATIGLLGINDIGRVFVPGEHAAGWHDGAGGGVFIGGRAAALSITWVHGTDGTQRAIGFGTGL